MKTFRNEKVSKLYKMQQEILKPLTTILGLARLYNNENAFSIVNPQIIKGIIRSTRIIELDVKQLLSGLEDLRLTPEKEFYLL